MNITFAIFRIIFGSYLIWHFAALIPYGPELFSDTGLIPDIALNLTSPFTPSIPISTTLITVLLSAGTLASLCFTAGFMRRFSAFFLWALLTGLFLRNNLIANPALPYTGLILLLSTLIPKGEMLAFSRRDPNWEQPAHIVRVALFLLALGYTFSGLTKLSSPSWIDGTALSYLLENPLARPNIVRDVFLSVPPTILKICTWGTLVAELLYLPLAISKKTRPWIWLTLLSMHFGLLVLIDFADLSVGMIMIHLFTFEPRWLSARLPRNKSFIKVFFDNNCLMCNRFIHLLSDEDHRDLLRFSALPQGRDPESILVERDNTVFQESTAILVILESLGGTWRVLALLGRVFPRFLRDCIYRIIAKNRHKFLRRKTCPLPSSEVRRRILN